MATQAQTQGSNRSSEVRWHLAQLDALRGLAVLGVVLVHCGLTASHRLASITFIGQRGVHLFFAVSAFTLFLSTESRRQETHAQAAFFLRRYFRLAPMYYVTFLLTFFFAPATIENLPTTILQLFFLHGFVPSAANTGVLGSWSLTNEAFFYMTLPFLFRWIRSLRTALWWIAIVSPISFVLSYGMAYMHRDLSVFFTLVWFPVEFPVFLMGIAAFFLWKERLRDKTGTPEGRKLSLQLIGLAALIFIPLIPLGNRNIITSSCALGLFTAALALHPWPVLVNRVTILLGKVSYSIYLLHFLVLYTLLPALATRYHFIWPGQNSPLPTLLGHFAVVLGISTAFAVAAWKLVEQPGIRLGRSVIAAMQGRNLRSHDIAPVPLEALVNKSDSPDAQI